MTHIGTRWECKSASLKGGWRLARRERRQIPPKVLIDTNDGQRERHQKEKTVGETSKAPGPPEHGPQTAPDIKKARGQHGGSPPPTEGEGNDTSTPGRLKGWLRERARNTSGRLQADDQGGDCLQRDHPEGPPSTQKTVAGIRKLSGPRPSRPPGGYNQEGIIPLVKQEDEMGEKGRWRAFSLSWSEGA